MTTGNTVPCLGMLEIKDGGHIPEEDRKLRACPLVYLITNSNGYTHVSGVRQHVCYTYATTTTCNVVFTRTDCPPDSPWFSDVRRLIRRTVRQTPSWTDSWTFGLSAGLSAGLSDVSVQVSAEIVGVLTKSRVH